MLLKVPRSGNQVPKVDKPGIFQTALKDTPDYSMKDFKNRIT